MAQDNNNHQEVKFDESTDFKAYGWLDDRLNALNDDIQQHKYASGPTLIEQVIDAKEPIDRFLRQTDALYEKSYPAGLDLLTNIKIANDQCELERRVSNKAKLQHLHETINQATERSTIQLDDLFKQLTMLHDIQLPALLNEELRKKKKELVTIVNAKDDVIKLFQQEIDRNNQFYYRNSRQQENDIYCLGKRINAHVDTLREFFKNQIKLLETILDAEWQKNTEQASIKWTEQYEANAEHFKKSAAIEVEKRRTCNEQLESIRGELMQRTRTAKQKFESEKELFQFQMKTLKSKITLNMEQIKYSYRILNRKRIENVLIQSFEKHKIAKMNERIFNLQRRLNELKCNSEQEIERATKHIAKIRLSIKLNENHIERKQKANREQFVNAWQIHEIEASTLHDKICGIERVLYEDLLGLDWQRPEFEKIAMATVVGEYERNGTHDQNYDMDFVFNTKRAIIRQICDEWGFILDDRLLSIIQPFSDVDRSIIAVDNIFRALKIENIAKMETLDKYFQKYFYCPNCSVSDRISKEIDGELISAHTTDDDQSALELNDAKPFLHSNIQNILDNYEERQPTSNPSTQPNAMKTCTNHELFIETQDVKYALKDFIHSNDKDIEPQMLNATTTPNTYLMSDQQINSYWSNYTSPFDERNKRIWKAFEIGLNQMLKVLKTRKNLDQECELLRRQNFELKYSLKYILSTTNETQIKSQ